MIKNIDEIFQRKASKVAGIMFLFSFIVPSLNWAFILSKLVVEESVIATATNIISHELQFRIGITIELIMSVGLMVLGLALYVILKPVSKNISLLALLLKLIEATLAACIVLISFIALQLINVTEYISIFTEEQLQLAVGLILNVHTVVFSIPMVFLGLDMMVFSYLFFKSKYVPRLLAGFGVFSFALIFIHSLMFVLAPEYATMPINKLIFWTPSGLFEIIMGVWLLIKGLRIRQS